MINYKTEGKVQIDCSKSVCDPIAVTWLKGDNHVSIRHSSASIDLSKDQLLKLASLAEQIADDIRPDMGSLPRPA